MLCNIKPAPFTDPITTFLPKFKGGPDPPSGSAHRSQGTGCVAKQIYRQQLVNAKMVEFIKRKIKSIVGNRQDARNLFLRTVKTQELCGKRFD